MPNIGKKLKDRLERIKSRYTGKNKDEDKWPTEPAKDFITWEAFFMEIALLSKERSDHPHYKVNECTSVSTNVLTRKTINHCSSASWPHLLITPPNICIHTKILISKCFTQ